MASKCQALNHVNYLKPNGRLQSARIKVVNSQTNLDLQIGHHTTLTGKLKFVSGNQSGTWRKTA